MAPTWADPGLLFLPLAVSKAASCDGTEITTSEVGQALAPGTLPFYLVETSTGI